MNNKILIGIVLAVVVIGSIFYFTKKQYQPAQQTTPQQTQTPASANTVTIQNFSFNPGTLTVSQGTKITWINQDAAVHKIKSDTFNSSDLNQGDTFDFTFTAKGTFDYSCAIHPSMTGKIVVE